MASFSPVGSSAITVSASGVNVRTTQNISLLLSDVEYVVTIPVGTRQFSLHSRTLSTLKITDISAGTDYYTVPKGCGYSETNLLLTGGLTLYVTSSVNNNILEIVSWS